MKETKVFSLLIKFIINKIIAKIYLVF